MANMRRNSTGGIGRRTFGGFMGAGLLSSNAGVESTLTSVRDSVVDRATGTTQTQRESAFNRAGTLTRHAGLAGMAMTGVGLLLPQTRARTMTMMSRTMGHAMRGTERAGRGVLGFGRRNPMTATIGAGLLFSSVGMEREMASFRQGLVPESMRNRAHDWMTSASGGQLGMGAVFGASMIGAMSRRAGPGQREMGNMMLGGLASSDAGAEDTLTQIRDSALDSFTGTTQQQREANMEYAGHITGMGSFGLAMAAGIGLAMPQTRARTATTLATVGSSMLSGAGRIGGAGLGFASRHPVMAGLGGGMLFSEIGMEREADAFRRGFFPQPVRDRAHSFTMDTTRRAMDSVQNIVTRHRSGSTGGMNSHI